MAVITRRAAVAPVGWPMAIAPPLTFVRSRIVSARCSSHPARMWVVTSGTAAKASLISITSMSSMPSPTFSSAMRPAVAGIEAMRSGWPDAIDQPWIVASGSTFRRCASATLISSSAVAPVLRPGALPAVTVALPYTVGSFASFSTVVSDRADSSALNKTGSPLRWGISTGTIWSSSRPASRAAR